MRTLSKYGNVVPCHSEIFKLLKISKLISWSHGRAVNNPDMIRTFFTRRCLGFPMNGLYVRHRGRQDFTTEVLTVAVWSPHTFL
jgi:hypothetical protein